MNAPIDPFIDESGLAGMKGMPGPVRVFMHEYSKEEHLAGIRSLAQNASFWKERAEVAEKACTEMSYRMAEAYYEIEGLGDGAPDSAPWAQACNRAEGHLMHGEVGKQLGRTQISLTDPVIVELEKALMQCGNKLASISCYETRWENPRMIEYREAIATYEARKKEARL